MPANAREFSKKIFMVVHGYSRSFSLKGKSHPRHVEVYRKPRCDSDMVPI